MDLKLLKDIVQIVDSHEVFLHGKSLFQLLNHNFVKSVQLWIKSPNDISFECKNKLLALDPNLKITVSSKNPINLEYVSCYQIFANIRSIIIDQCEIEGSDIALHDCNAKNIQFTSLGKDEIKNKPEIILETFTTACKYDYIIEINTLNLILKNKSQLVHLTPAKKLHYVKDLAFSAKKRRKSFATFNALGFSNTMFGVNITEASHLNHIARRDYNAFFAVAFKKIKSADLDMFLIDNFSMYLKDVEIVKILRTISDEAPEHTQTDEQLKDLISKLQLEKILHLRKFFKAHNLHKFYSKIKKLKDENKITKRSVPISLSRIKLLFNVDSNIAKSLLDMAKQLCITNPSLYNNTAQLLIELNKGK